MKNNMFIPKKIKVGFQNRSSTYTGKLAYITYFDEKGVLRKETSWDGWRDKKIEPQEFDNNPKEGFVLNKKAGDYMSYWNHRQAYCRVYDPDGFEFEITIENLLYILENTNSIKGKGLEGEFVYCWSGKDLVLLPTCSPDYKDLAAYNEKRHNGVNLKGKDLKIGGTYLTKDNREVVYVGRFDYHDRVWGNGVYADKNKGKHYWFTEKDKKKGYSWERVAPRYKFEQKKSIGQFIIDTVDENCYENYADMFNDLERDSSYSPVDRYEYIEYTYDEFYNKIETRTRQYNDGSPRIWFDDLYNCTGECHSFENYKDSYRIYSRRDYRDITVISGDIYEIFNEFKPCYRNTYLKNNKLNRSSKYE